MLQCVKCLVVKASEAGSSDLEMRPQACSDYIEDTPHLNILSIDLCTSLKDFFLWVFLRHCEVLCSTNTGRHMCLTDAMRFARPEPRNDRYGIE